jgi:hypothetical protein
MSRNTLIGYGATLPPGSNDLVVLGGPSATTSLGNGSVLCNSGNLNIAFAELWLGNQAGQLGQQMRSAGYGTAPYWGGSVNVSGALAPQYQLASLYVATGSSEWSLVLPSAGAGSSTVVKSIATVSGYVGANIVPSNSSSWTTAVVMGPNDIGTFVTDGDLWYVDRPFVPYVPSGSQAFSATGAVQIFTVPSLVTSITAVVSGSRGGGFGGPGCTITATLTVSPGQNLQIVCGSGTFGGGGSALNTVNGNVGGGYSAIFTSDITLDSNGVPSPVSTDALQYTFVIAAGGGGRGRNGGPGAGGFIEGGSSSLFDGGGGTQSAGGAGGAAPVGQPNGGSGSLFQGGTYLGDGGTYPAGSAGGGGGGYYGGGSGSNQCSGGGGSSYPTTTTSLTTITYHADGTNFDTGSITLSWGSA